MTHHFAKCTIFTVFALLLTLVSGAAQGQQQGTAQTQTAQFAVSPADTDAEMAALQTKMKALQIQHQIEALESQQEVLEKQEQASAPALSTDAEMAAAQGRMKILQIKKQIAALQAQQSALLNPPAPASPPAKAVVADCIPGTAPQKKTAFGIHIPKSLQDQINKAAAKASAKAGVDFDPKAPANALKDAQTSHPCPAGISAAAVASK